MATKTCPSCGAEVPVDAMRCKHCFHDFTETPKKSSNGLLGLLALVAAMAVVGAGTFWFVNDRQAQPYIVVDEETHSIVFTTKYADRTETDRVRFEDVAKVELIMGGSEATYHVQIITLDGEKMTVELSDDKPLQGYAQHLAAVLDKPLVETNKARGFGDGPSTP